MARVAEGECQPSRRAADGSQTPRRSGYTSEANSGLHRNSQCVIPAPEILNNMLLKTIPICVVLLLWTLHFARSDYSPDVTNYQASDNVQFPKNINPGGLSSIFSPRMDFDRWKPLTGRGDPLRNDPTYDYEPPVLERVHYWADDTRLDREKHSERKSEVLVLGVSSRKPSIVSKPPMPLKRSPRPPVNLPKYEDYSYKLSNDYPITILVPPPPPPPGQKPVLFVDTKEGTSSLTTSTYVEPTHATVDVLPNVELITSYALQEANLIYQSSTKHGWYEYDNITNNFPNISVSSDYAGWGPTTPFNDNDNESHNIIPQNGNNFKMSEQKYKYQKAKISDVTRPFFATTKILPPFLPTIIPPTTKNNVQETWFNPDSTLEASTEIYEQITQSNLKDNDEVMPSKTTQTPAIKINHTVVDMLAPMMSMPMVADSDISENDNLFAHASESISIFREPTTNDDLQLEAMQTMQPPPPIQIQDSSTQSPYHHLHANKFDNTHDPYLHMRYTTPLPTTDNTVMAEKQHAPSYLIIQGHSKVKTYGSKPKPIQYNNGNEIVNSNETNEVKHLHPIKEKKKNIDTKNREGRSKNLKSLIDKGFGSIEIQEADIGIKYDISDGSNVPVEVYKKGIVDNDENNYGVIRKNITENRFKRQIDIDNLLPFDEDTLEEFVYDFFDSRQNNSGIVGILAQTITNKKVASLVDSLEDDDENVSENTEDR